MEEISVLSNAHPDTLQFCDEDIQAIFESGTSYFTFEPLLAQLIKELRLLRSGLGEVE